MTSFERYAEYYDLIYQDKDYEGECDFIEEIFRTFSPHPVNTVLDGGCGTAGHAISLARRGYAVTGFDSSEIMLKRAREKAAECDLNLVFHVGDLRRFDFGEKFDTCICMFAVIGYVTETEDILKTLRNIRRHLDSGSLFIFDFWNGLAVLRILPSTRTKIIQNEKLRIIRIAEPELDSFNHLCHVHYRLLVHSGDTLIDEIVETHVMRYYFPREIIHYLNDAGFEVLKIGPFLRIDDKVDENIWNLVAIAKVV